MYYLNQFELSPATINFYFLKSFDLDVIARLSFLMCFSLTVGKARQVNISAGNYTLLIEGLLETLLVTNCISLKNWHVSMMLLPVPDLQRFCLNLPLILNNF